MTTGQGRVEQIQSRAYYLLGTLLAMMDSAMLGQGLHGHYVVELKTFVDFLMGWEEALGAETV